MATRPVSVTMLLLAAAAGCTGVPVTPSFAPRPHATEGDVRSSAPGALATPLMVEDALFQVVEQGRGDPVVFLPADPETGPGTELQAMMKELAAHHHVAAYATADRHLLAPTDGHVWDEATGGAMEMAFDAERPLSVRRHPLPPVQGEPRGEVPGCNAEEFLGHSLETEARLTGVRRQTRQRAVPTLLVDSGFPDAATLLVFLAGRDR